MLRRIRNIALAFTLVFALTSTVLTAPAQASTAPVAPAAAQKRVPVKISAKKFIKKVEARQGKRALDKRQKVLAKSKALTSLIAKTVAKKQRATYLRFLAAASSNAQANRLVKRTKGKHFVATVRGGNVAISIVKGSGNSVVTHPGVGAMKTLCPEAYIAFYAWWAATAVICQALNIGFPGAGIVCALVVGLFALTFIDFSDACKKVPAGAV